MTQQSPNHINYVSGLQKQTVDAPGSQRVELISAEARRSFGSLSSHRNLKASWGQALATPSTSIVSTL